MSENWNVYTQAPSSNDLQDSFSTLPPVQNPPAKEPSPNYLLGIIGALLGAALGCALWVLVYQLGFISAACGVLMVFFTMTGFRLLGRNLNAAGIIISILIALAMVYVSTYLSIVVYCHLEWTKEPFYSGTLKDSFEIVKELLNEHADLRKDFNKELLTGYGLSLLGAGGGAARSIKEKK